MEMQLTWDEQRRLWYGYASFTEEHQIEVGISVGSDEPEVIRAYAEFAFSRFTRNFRDAQAYAARKLADSYNYYQSHIQDGEQVTPEHFGARLRLEGIRFRGEGKAHFDFCHDLYRGDYLHEGGLVVVETSVDGKLRRAYWVTEPDAEDLRQKRRRV
ncbi:MAG: hypothetical protein ACRC8S_01840 [Fimbriiglobus sp.]